ncbi:hypothetical protein XA68_17901 [Ophiocordyceps unilateralis]|uniref:Uncharacterized protein n=1 Tax=Ophiocordyceps unilateralis TaxID=268505 RepID=A0A2A9P390_OPHUN|nr:hypothetical protein XA68_17901 [Ophiocordyceps unilateralis]
MLDDNLPTYRLLPSPDDPLHSFAYFSHNGSEPTATYLVKRPPPAASRGQYALGLLDAQCPSLVYAEVLVRPEWSQPTLSAAEMRAASSPPRAVPLVPDAFNIELCNPDLAVAVKLRPASWNKSDAWEFELPETSFKLPSASRIDQDADAPPVAALAPRICFRWKRDSRLTKDMTCYMCGRSVGGTKSKEPDITVAMFRAAKNQGAVTIYEPNLARVDVQDRKGLELIFLLGSVAIRDLYLAHRSDPFNLAGASAAPTKASGPQPAFASGALAGPATAAPSPLLPPRHQQQQQQQPPSSGGRDAEMDAETRRLRAMMEHEERQARERQRRDQEEQRRIERMLADEEARERRRREAEVERETERLRREYGVPPGNAPPMGNGPPPGPPNGGWWQGAPGGGPAPPPRPNSVGDRRKYSNPLNYLMHGPYGGSGPGASSSSSGFFHRSDERRGRMQKKRSVHF